MHKGNRLTAYCRLSEARTVIGKHMTTIKCFKTNCPICNRDGTAQVFLRKDNTVSYTRVRHYSHIDTETHKPQFTYCKLQNDTVETLLSQAGISLTALGQVGQGSSIALDSKHHDQKLKEYSSVSQIDNKSYSGAGSLARLGHLLDVQKVTGSNPVRPTTLISFSVDERFCALCCLRCVSLAAT